MSGPWRRLFHESHEEHAYYHLPRQRHWWTLAFQHAAAVVIWIVWTLATTWSLGLFTRDRSQLGVGRLVVTKAPPYDLAARLDGRTPPNSAGAPLWTELQTVHLTDHISGISTLRVFNNTADVLNMPTASVIAWGEDVLDSDLDFRVLTSDDDKWTFDAWSSAPDHVMKFVDDCICQIEQRPTDTWDVAAEMCFSAEES